MIKPYQKRKLLDSRFYKSVWYNPKFRDSAVWSGTGKTTLAKALAQRMKATYLRIDTIEQALQSSLKLSSELGSVGYDIAFSLEAHECTSAQQRILE